MAFTREGVNFIVKLPRSFDAHLVQKPCHLEYPVLGAFLSFRRSVPQDRAQQLGALFPRWGNGDLGQVRFRQVLVHVFPHGFTVKSSQPCQGMSHPIPVRPYPTMTRTGKIHNRHRLSSSQFPEFLLKRCRLLPQLLHLVLP